jgi:hypothetical protein
LTKKAHTFILYNNKNRYKTQELIVENFIGEEISEKENVTSAGGVYYVGVDADGSSGLYCFSGDC